MAVSKKSRYAVIYDEKIINVFDVNLLALSAMSTSSLQQYMAYDTKALILDMNTHRRKHKDYMFHTGWLVGLFVCLSANKINENVVVER